MPDHHPAGQHGSASTADFRPRTYRTRTHLVYEAVDGTDYRIDLRRLQTDADLLRVVQWLCLQPGVTAVSLEAFIRVARNACRPSAR